MRTRFSVTIHAENQMLQPLTPEFLLTPGGKRECQDVFNTNPMDSAVILLAPPTCAQSQSHDSCCGPLHGLSCQTSS